MEGEERPAKKRRLSVEPSSATNELSQTNGESQIDEHQHEPTSKENLADLFDDELDGDKAVKPNDGIHFSNTRPTSPSGTPMSKNQQKKLRKKLEWESKRDQRKAIRKEKIVAKRERRKEAKLEAAAVGIDNEAASVPSEPKPEKSSPVQLPVTFMIDCDFDNLMLDKERISLAAQITRSYSDNKNASFRAHLAVCSFGGKLRERFETVLTHHTGWRGVRWLDCDFVQAAEKAKRWMGDDVRGGKPAGTFSAVAEKSKDDIAKLKDEGEIVYLTSEGDETLTELKPYSTYIIGGLVDKNREKGICYKRARAKDVRTARLPIGEFMDMQGRKVLATNHVNEIMLKWLECGDWAEAFVKVIPKRKRGKLKNEMDLEQDGGLADEDAASSVSGIEECADLGDMLSARLPETTAPPIVKSTGVDDDGEPSGPPHGTTEDHKPGTRDADR